MAEKQNTPEIRFEGFTDPWEQRKLGELCTFSKGHGYSKADIRDAGTPLILYGRLYTQYESRIEEVDTFTVEQDGSILSRGNEVIVPASGETAEDIAIASSVRRSGIILGGDLNVVTPTGKLDPDYTALAITYSKAHDDLAKRAQGKSVVHVHGNDIAEVEISYPSESEQKRISSVVLNLDSLITLHQRKYDKLCTVKKSMLDKMFPKLGETEPEIRFEGFTDPWEQRKLGEVASIKTGPFGSLLHAEDYVVDGIPIVTTEHFKSGFLPDEIAGLPQVSESDRARLEQYSAIEGDILFSRVGSVDVNAQVTAAQSGWLFSGRVLRARPTVSVISPNYLHYELSTDDVKRSIINRAVGGTMASINTEILEDTEISFPRSRTEQLEIGRSLGNLDSLIALHQRKLELLRNIKKSLLDRMFV